MTGIDCLETIKRSARLDRDEVVVVAADEIIIIILITAHRHIIDARLVEIDEIMRDVDTRRRRPTSHCHHRRRVVAIEPDPDRQLLTRNKDAKTLTRKDFVL